MQPRRHGLALTLLAILAAMTVWLSVAAAGPATLPGDVALARRLQAVPLAAGARLGWIGFWAGSAPVVFVVAGLAAFLLWRHGHTRLVAVVLGILLLRALNPVLKTIIASPRPTAGQVTVTELAPEYGFPSGHTMGATLLYGGLIWLAGRTIEVVWVRRLVQAAAVLVILITGFGRVQTGAHWPSDVLGGLLWGWAGLALLAIWAGRFLPPGVPIESSPDAPHEPGREPADVRSRKAAVGRARLAPSRSPRRAQS